MAQTATPAAVPVPVHLYRLRVAHMAASWPELRRRLPVLLDMFAEADEDGTNGMRSVPQTVAAMVAAGIPIPQRTVERHRAWAVTNGLARVQERGGRHAQATVYSTRLPDKHPPLSTVEVAAPPTRQAPATLPRESGGSSAEHPPSTRHSPATLPPESGAPCSPVVEASKQQTARPTTGKQALAEQLAAAKGWPIKHCLQALDTKAAELAARGIERPGTLLARIVANSPDELPAPAVVRITARQCDSADAHDKHQWAAHSQPHMCLGVDDHALAV